MASVALGLPRSASALDYVLYRNGQREEQVTGRVLVRAADDSQLVVGRDGVYHVIAKDQIVEQRADNDRFEPFEPDELGKQLLGQLPAGFEVYTTQNYVICHNTSRAYAQWCGALFEQLLKGATNYWTKKGLELRRPEFPLAAIVFADQQSYAAFARPELGSASSQIIGYYSFQTNRMTMYDLTGVEALRRPGDRRASAAQINEMLTRPEAERTVATVVHEATHQIAYNCGLHVRYSDVPLWVSEGLAVFFETPDLSNSKGWSTIGAVNRVRLSTFRESLRSRPFNSLETLVADNRRFRDPQQALDAYAEAWAWHYFLSRQKSRQYVDYLKLVADKPVLRDDPPDVKLREFRQVFGEDLKQLDAEFLRYMAKVR